MANDRYELNKNLAQLLKGGVIMDVTMPEQARIAEDAGACAVMALGSAFPPTCARRAASPRPRTPPRMMQLDAEGVFVGSGIFKSSNPAKRAAAIVKAVANFSDAKLLAELSENLGDAMVGINEQEIQLRMAERGK